MNFEHLTVTQTELILFATRDSIVRYAWSAATAADVLSACALPAVGVDYKSFAAKTAQSIAGLKSSVLRFRDRAGASPNSVDPALKHTLEAINSVERVLASASATIKQRIPYVGEENKSTCKSAASQIDAHLLDIQALRVRIAHIW